MPIQWLIGSTPRVFNSHRTQVIPSSGTEDAVMIAKVEGEKNMIVIEKIGEHVYTMCTLRKDLKVKDVRMVSKMSRESEPRPAEQEPQKEKGEMQVDGEWWKAMAIRPPFQHSTQDFTLTFLLPDPNKATYPLYSFILT
jgi:hypothetical protein